MHYFPKLVLLLCITFLSTNAVYAGGRENGGGDWLSTEFRERARFIIDHLSNVQHAILSVDQIQLLIASVADTRVEMTNEQLTDEFGGNAKASTIDDPARPGKKLIKVSEDDWQALLEGESPGNTITFVFHEYLRSIEIRDFNEFTSSQLKATEENFLEWIKKNRRAEDNVIAINVMVRGDLIPWSATSSPADLRTQALSSYAKNRRLWRASVIDTLKAEIGESTALKGIFIEKSRPIQNHDIINISGVRDVYASEKMHKSLLRNPDGIRALLYHRMYARMYAGQTAGNEISIGQRAMHEERISIYLDNPKIMMATKDINLETEARYWNTNYHSEADARTHFAVVYNLVQNDFRKRCEEWKKEVSDRLSGNWQIILTDCGLPRLERDDSALTLNDLIEIETQGPYYERYVHFFRLQGYRMRSYASIYYLENDP